MRKDSVTVQVLQTGPFLRAPSVVMQRPFTRVTLDGKPWRYVHGQTVFLPRARGVYRIETGGQDGIGRDVGGDGVVLPALARTGALVQSCRYDAVGRVLEVFTVADRTETASETAAAAFEYTAWFTGPAPVRVDGGELVPRESLPSGILRTQWVGPTQR